MSGFHLSVVKQNQNNFYDLLKQRQTIQVAGAKGGKTRGSKARLVLVLLLIGRKSGGVGVGVISSTESESEEPERFHFLPIPLMTPTLTIQ